MRVFVNNLILYVSIPDHDGTAMSLLESIASGAIPWLSDIKSSKEWIKYGENGFLCNPIRDDIIKNLNLILESSEIQLNRMREYNFRLVSEKADESKWMYQLYKDYLKIFNNVQ